MIRRTAVWIFFAVLALAGRFSHPTEGADIASDCLNVVKSCNGPAMHAVGPKRAYVGIMRVAIGSVE